MYPFYESALRPLLVFGILLVFIGATPVSAQEVDCDDVLVEAETDYERGRFDDAIEKLQKCLDMNKFNEEDRRKAYRVVALSYHAKDLEGEARSSIRQLLQLVPNYEPDPVFDPPSFVEMVEEIRREQQAQPPPDPQVTPPPADRPTTASNDSGGGGIGKWLLIGGAVVVVAVAAVLLLGGDDGDQANEVNEIEPNNGPSSAQRLNGPSPITVFGTAAVSDQGEIGPVDADGNVPDDVEDFFRVTIDSPGLRITLSELDSDCDLFLVDNQGQQILNRSENSGQVNEAINNSSLAPGTYLIGVSIFDPDPQGPSTSNYELRIEGSISSSANFALRQSLRPDVVDQSLTYRLLALPGNADAPVESVLPADASWRAFREIGTQVQEYDRTEAFHFKPGSGLWVHGESMPVHKQATTTPSPDADGHYTIELQPGWNIISNPTDVTLDWQAIQEAHGVTQGLWMWNGRYEQTTVFTSANTQDAFYFMNDRGLESLRLSVNEHATPTAPRLPQDQITLSVYRDRVQASAVQVGFLPEAFHGGDGFDQVAPPGYFETASLRLIGQPGNATAKDPTLLATDIRPKLGNGQSYDLVLASPVGEPIDLQADGLRAYASEEVVLIDQETGTSYDLKQHDVITLVPEALDTRLTLVIGSLQYVQQVRDAVVPGAFTLTNYPNPFSQSTAIAYTIPPSSDEVSVRLAVYDVLGRQVHMLTDEEQGPGSYQVAWDGTNEQGAAVASGVYLYRLQAGDHLVTGRMVLTR